MEKIRYAIVRVGKGGSCVEEFICSGNCNKCDYGDTKEDFEKKIETAITRIIQRKNIVIKYRNFDISMTIKNLSKTIAQYLGIEK